MRISSLPLMNLGRFAAVAVAVVSAGLAGCATSDSKARSKAKADACEMDCCAADGKSGPATKPTANAVVGHEHKLGTTITPSTKPAATQPATAPAASGWKYLFDGKTLGEWKASGFAAQGDPEVADGLLNLPTGEDLTGVTYKGEGLPTIDYEVEVVAKKVEGSDFFCGLTFPYKDSHASFIVGGWGGGVVGISSVNGEDALHNETVTYDKFEKDRWYTARVRLTADKIEAFIDNKQVVNLDTKGKKIDIRVGIEDAKPLGIASFRTTAAIKSVKIRKL